jgi:uncharacterized phage-associated protein
MIITHQREKLINAIIYFAKHTEYVGKLKLLKLLYLLDFCHFKTTGKSVTGLEYFAWEKGPVPKSLFEELENMQPDLNDAIHIEKIGTFYKIVPRKKFTDKYFTPREKMLLHGLSSAFKHHKADEMKEVTHLRKRPWDKTWNEKGPQAKIDYMLAIDDEQSSLPYGEAQDRMKEISEMHEIFGTT